jgi:SAM-dependent methyltransferase
LYIFGSKCLNQAWQAEAESLCYNVLDSENVLNDYPFPPDRIRVYVSYLPSYPVTYIEYLARSAELNCNSIVADIGAGAGILSKLLGPHAKQIMAIEPDAKMRQTAEQHLRDAANVSIISGSAEATGLEKESIDLITAGQAFHYFDIDQAKKEFRRILKPGGMVALSWHIRETAYPFGAEYEALLKRRCPGYTGNSGATWSADAFFQKGFEHRVFDNYRHIDLETLIGYSLAMPFSPVRGEPGFRDFIDDLTELYRRYSAGDGLELRSRLDSYLGEI